MNLLAITVCWFLLFLRNRLDDMVINRYIYLNKLIGKKQNGLIKVVTVIYHCEKSYLLLNLFMDYLLT